MWYRFAREVAFRDGRRVYHQVSYDEIVSKFYRDNVQVQDEKYAPNSQAFLFNWIMQNDCACMIDLIFVNEFLFSCYVHFKH